MSDVVTLKTALETGGAYVVWGLLDDEERRAAATALWRDADRQSRAALEVALAKEMKFRPQSIRRLPAERVAGRLVKMAETLPDTVLFQYLFHLHMAERREVMVAFLDAVELPHDDGVLELEEETEPPTADVVSAAASALHEKFDHRAVVYLATLLVADRGLWSNIEPVLEGFDDTGARIG